jgi:hypothetical protein
MKFDGVRRTRSAVRFDPNVASTILDVCVHDVRQFAQTDEFSRGVSLA